MTGPQVVVLGAGITGCLTACMLVDQGVSVTLIDRLPLPMCGASRWNEGKIHLGYTYFGTPSLDTALLMQDGAVVFESLIEEVTGTLLSSSWFTDPVIYLVDQHSMESAEVLWERSRAVADALQKNINKNKDLGRYRGTGALLERLTLKQAIAETGQGHIAAAWKTTERAIAPGPVAELIRSAVSSRQIPFLSGTVVAVDSVADGWSVRLQDGRSFVSACVVNTLWEGRPQIDRIAAGCVRPTSIRFKYGLFGSGFTKISKLAPSTRILGRFGDITPYANGDTYLSWYPAGLAALSDNGIPPVLPELKADSVTIETLVGLGLDPSWLDSAAWEVKGGFIVAEGYGDIDKIDSPLHDRRSPDAHRLAPGFISVDTGKYTLGPLLAKRAVDKVQQECAILRI
jgi:hypothetical protein